MIGVVRVDGLCMFVMIVELDFYNASGCIRGDGVACVGMYLDSTFLPLDSF
jgi:hypothetical protein